MQDMDRDRDRLRLLQRSLFGYWFRRLLMDYYVLVPTKWRYSLEVLSTTKAVLSVLCLLYFHSVYLANPADCLAILDENWLADGGVVRVEIRRTQPLLPWHERRPSCKEIPRKCNGHWIEEWIPLAKQMEHVSYFKDTEEYDEASCSLIVRTQPLDSDRVVRNQYEEAVSLSNMSEVGEEKQESTNFDDCEVYSIFEYATVYGFLKLSDCERYQRNITLWRIILDSSSNDCFKGNAARTSLEFLGYDDMLMASLKHRVHKFKTMGFVRNLITGQHYRFIESGWLLVTILEAWLKSFVMTAFATLVFQQIHHCVFKFVLSSQENLVQGSPIVIPLSSLCLIILAILGLESMLAYFFRDDVTTLAIMCMAWAGNLFYTLCCHSPISQLYWKRFYYLYQLMFYTYQCCFNGLFSFLALLCCYCLFQHSMVFFVHHYEIPFFRERARNEAERRR
eukprot:m.155033 g.155033  ORF g.155033 m.155033 type:complete len:450 (+) comp38651_c0_seq18:28-1377(+)